MKCVAFVVSLISAAAFAESQCRGIERLFPADGATNVPLNAHIWQTEFSAAGSEPILTKSSFSAHLSLTKADPDSRFENFVPDADLESNTHHSLGARSVKREGCSVSPGLALMLMALLIRNRRGRS